MHSNDWCARWTMKKKNYIREKTPRTYEKEQRKKMWAIIKILTKVSKMKCTQKKRTTTTTTLYPNDPQQIGCQNHVVLYGSTHKFTIHFVKFILWELCIFFILRAQTNNKPTKNCIHKNDITDWLICVCVFFFSILLS